MVWTIYIHVHGRIRLETLGYTGWPSSMPTTRDTNRSFGDRWSGAFFESGSPISPVLPGRDGEVGYYFLQIPLPRRSWWSCLADEWPRYPRDHWLVMPSLSWIIDQWTVSPAAKHSNATYSTCDPQPPLLLLTGNASSHLLRFLLCWNFSMANMVSLSSSCFMVAKKITLYCSLKKIRF